MMRIALTRVFCAVLVLAAAFGLSPAARAGTTPAAWVARHNMSPADYQKEFDDFGAKGFRLVSVSGYVVDDKVQYAALWRKVPGGPGWAARHGLSIADFKKAIADQHKKGMNLVYVDGYEVGNAVLFAGIWEASSAPQPTVNLAMTADEYQTAFNAMKKKGLRLRDVAGYTKDGDATYAAIWDTSTGPELEARHGMSPDDFQKTFDDLSKKGFRLTRISGYSPSGGDQYAAMWEKAGSGPWEAHFGTKLEDYQTQVDVDRYQGFQPLFVQAFTSGGTARFDTIWQSPFSNKDFKAIFDTLNGAVKSTPVAGLSIAIARNGHLLFASGFGMADKENNVAMNVNHRLRIGSTSKTTTAVAIFRLIQAGAKFNGNHKLTLDSPVFGPDGILHDITLPPLLAPYLKKAKVHHFLEHTSGIPSNAGDPVHCDAGNLDNRIAYQLGTILPIGPTATDPVGPVPRDPGTKFNYSNINFQILQAVIERVSGMSYQSYLLKHVFGPMGITAPRLFHIGGYDASTGEAKQYLANGDYAEYSSSGTCDDLPPGVGAGGWSMSARDLLRYLTDVDGIQPGEVLSTANRAAMLHRPLDDNPGNTALDPYYARGWLTQGWGACNTSWKIVQGHDGGLSGGYSNMFFLQENGFSFVVIGNQDSGMGKCRPSPDAGKPPPAKVPCGGKNQPPCSDEPTARVIDLIRSIDWPNYDLF